MGLTGLMVCRDCSEWGQHLQLDEGMRWRRGLRRCKRCAALVSVPLAYIDAETGEWIPQSGRARCQRWYRESEAACGSQALEPIPEVPDPGTDLPFDDAPAPNVDTLTQPCHECGGTMLFESTAICD